MGLGWGIRDSSSFPSCDTSHPSHSFEWFSSVSSLRTAPEEWPTLQNRNWMLHSGFIVLLSIAPSYCRTVGSIGHGVYDGDPGKISNLLSNYVIPPILWLTVKGPYRKTPLILKPETQHSKFSTPRASNLTLPASIGPSS